MNPSSGVNVRMYSTNTWIKEDKVCVINCQLSLWHYLADLGRGVEFLPEIKIPVGSWPFQEIDPKCYTFLESLFTGLPSPAQLNLQACTISILTHLET